MNDLTPNPAAQLTPEQFAHITALQEARPDWKVAVVVPLVSDEKRDQTGDHSYPLAHPYITGMQYALRRLRPACDVLDIGSPLAQVVAMTSMGMTVTVVDIRQYPDPVSLGVWKWVKANACATGLPDASQRIITSFWAIAHIGDGRYGDDLRADGDLQFLREIYRLLAPGGVAHLGVGPMDDTAGCLFNLHRVYSWKWLLPQLEEIGFLVTEKTEVPVCIDMYLDGSWGDKPEIAAAHGGREGVYGIVSVRKP